VLLRIPRVHLLDRFLLQSGTGLTVASFLAVAAALAAGGSVAALLAGAPAVFLPIAALLPVLGWAAYVQHKRRRRMHQIGMQLPDALDLMARAMQAGHAFSSALRLVGTDGPQPIAQEFMTVFDEINFGITFDKAMGNLASRVASGDLRFFVVAVLIQRDSGGNLAGILTSIAALLRDRQKLFGTIRVLSAEGRISAWILTLLPFILALAITLINRDFIALLWTDPAGVRLVAISLGLMLVGIWWMWRMVRIRV
jgi:tight adherence protein B